MSYIFVVDEDAISERSFNIFASGKGYIALHKNRVREVRKMDLEEYCQEYADRLFKKNADRLNRLSESEREEIFRDDPGIMYRLSPNILYIYKPSEIKKRLDDYEKRIKVGDVVLFSYYGDIVKGLVTKVGKGACSDLVYAIQKDGTADICSLDDCEKTGEHYDSIDEFMEK
jgi:hypothetical protein